MKKLLIGSAITTLLISGAAQAQMTMETGDVSFGYTFNPDSTRGASLLDLTVRGDFAVGPLGVQLDGYTGTFIGRALSGNAIYAVTGHAYKQFDNGMKAGAYVGYDSLSTSGSSLSIVNYGVEALANFGNLDLEASLGWLDVTNQSNGVVFVAGVNAYYNISPAFEISASYENFSNNNNSVTSTSIYEIGVGYTLSNMPISVGASYSYIDENRTAVVGLNIGYSFGDPSDERLFRTHSYPFKFLLASGPT